MTKQHPITPPPELVKQLTHMLKQHTDAEVFTQVARWGADQELEACREWVADHISVPEAAELRATRRPRPPSLKEQALEQLQALEQAGALDCNIDAIRRALEALPDG